MDNIFFCFPYCPNKFFTSGNSALVHLILIYLHFEKVKFSRGKGSADNKGRILLKYSLLKAINPSIVTSKT